MEAGCTPRGGRLLAALTCLVAVAAPAVHLSRAAWGLDRTDEGQYLLLLARPEDSRFTVFLAGYVLHPLYALLGGDVAALRVAGILGCVAVCALLGFAVARAVVPGPASRTAAVVTAVVAGAFGVGPSLWFPLTPGYNTLAFWGVALWASGVAFVVGASGGRAAAGRNAAAEWNEGTRRVGGAAGPSVAAAGPGTTGVGATASAGRGRARPAPGVDARGLVGGGALMGVGGVVAFSGKVTTAAALAAMTVAVAGALAWSVRRRTPSNVVTCEGSAAASAHRRRSEGRRTEAPAASDDIQGGFLGPVAAGLFAGAAAAGFVLFALLGHGPGWLVGFLRDGLRSVDLLEGHEQLVRLDPVSAATLFGPVALAGAATLGLALAAATLPGAIRWARVACVGAAGLAAIAAVALAARERPSTPLDLFAWWWLPVLALVAALLPRARAEETRGAGGGVGATPGPPRGSSPAPVLGRSSESLPTGPASYDAADPDDAPPPGDSAGHPAGTGGGAAGGCTTGSPDRPDRSAARLVLAVALAVAPLAYVVGTNGNWWTSQARAAVFWVLAAVVVLAGRPALRAALLAGAAVMVLVGSVGGLGYAYRYAPPGHGVSAAVAATGARLDLTAADAATTARLQTVAREHRLAGVPMIDTTGASPGYIFQLGGVPLGSTWLLGGYPGSRAAALDALRAADPADLRRAWILDAPRSPRRIDGLLPALGLDPAAYDVATTFRSVAGYDVRLLKPRLP